MHQGQHTSLETQSAEKTNIDHRFNWTGKKGAAAGALARSRKVAKQTWADIGHGGIGNDGGTDESSSFYAGPVSRRCRQPLSDQFEEYKYGLISAVAERLEFPGTFWYMKTL